MYYRKNRRFQYTLTTEMYVVQKVPSLLDNLRKFRRIGGGYRLVLLVAKYTLSDVKPLTLSILSKKSSIVTINCLINLNNE